jgi:hypothetical protein
MKAGLYHIKETDMKEKEFVGIDDRGNAEFWQGVIDRIRALQKEEWDKMTPEEQEQARIEAEARRAAGLSGTGGL